jgi:Rrf2 family cysteine metabolism transcriptional repressor
MKISTKGRYGTRAMLALAEHYGTRLVRANEIADEQSLSLKYLENLLSSLKAAGLVVSERGKRGGYALARPPAGITLYDVLSPLEDSLGFVHCTETDRGCDRLPICVTREVWVELKDATDRILTRTTLEDLLKRQEALRSAAASSGRTLKVRNQAIC